MGQCPTRRCGGRFRGGPKKGLQTALEAEVAQEVEALLGREALAELDFEALEVALRQRTLRLAAHDIEQRLNADLSDEASARLRCPCGSEARYVARRTKNVVSVLGPLRLERAYYHCSSCGQGFCPRDRQLGLENSSLSPALSRMTGTVGAMVSFQEGSALLRELAGVPVDAKQVERTAEALGKEIAEAERSPFAQRVWREATRRRFCQAPRRVVLGDGAVWIWNIADDQFPGATQIVDRYHAKEYLSDLGKALYGPTAPRAAQWAERRKEELDTGKFLALLNAIRRQVPRSDLARRCLHYFKTNRERMRYPEFHAQGLCTSSGVVEAGCKVAIGTRLKRAGMHWTKQGSNAIIALRCSKLSGRFQDFWERRSELRAA